jgi:hypothetical protein
MPTAENSIITKRLSTDMNVTEEQFKSGTLEITLGQQDII